MNQQLNTPRIAMAALCGLLLSACVTTPEPLRGEYPAIPPENVSRSVDDAGLGQAVRWGGTIIAAEPESDRTCVEILSKPLDDIMRPVDQDQSTGRFVACKNRFLDPEVFAQGRELTIIGELQRLDTRQIGEFDYRYPVVEADILYLWPERRDVYYPHYAAYPYYWPYSRFGHFGFYHPYSFHYYPYRYRRW